MNGGDSMKTPTMSSDFSLISEALIYIALYIAALRYLPARNKSTIGLSLL